MQRVPEKKSCLFVESVGPLRVCGGALELTLRTHSPPLVLTVHVNQEPRARLTVFWDNTFCELAPAPAAANDARAPPGYPRLPFLVPARVAWSALKRALAHWFAVGSGRALAEHHLQFLTRKLRASLMHSHTLHSQFTHCAMLFSNILISLSCNYSQ